jgi:hypothetical protein
MYARNSLYAKRGMVKSILVGLYTSRIVQNLIVCIRAVLNLKIMWPAQSLHLKKLNLLTSAKNPNPA